MFKDKRIVLGITGGIAAYKACELASALKKEGAFVHVIMTKNATEFVSLLTFEALSGNAVTVDMFEKNKNRDVRHISLAKNCDVAVIAPCSANVIGKISAGIADDSLSTFIMACKAPVVLAPAMNTHMYESAAYSDNAALLKKRGFLFIEPDTGRLACGDSGKGRMKEPALIVEYLRQLLSVKRDYDGKRVLITAGPTISKIDPVRYVCNYSSGKMGIEIARAASLRGAEVTVITGKITEPIDFRCRRIDVTTTTEMYDSVMSNLECSDYIIKAAAPSDYVVDYSGNKIKDDSFTLRMSKGVDIAAEIGKIKGDKKLVIFAAESENLHENAVKKLKKKNADMVVANNITTKGAGFNADTNIASIISKDGSVCDLEMMSKKELAHIILDNLIGLA